MILSDYGKGALNDVPGMIRRARAAGIPVLVDPKGTDFEKYLRCHPADPHTCPSSRPGGQGEVKKTWSPGAGAGQALRAGRLLVTRSENGMTLIREGQPELHLPAQAHEVYDVTGAGDTVISTWRLPLPQARVWTRPAPRPTPPPASWSAAGTSTVSPVELANALYTEQETGFGVMSEAQLKVAVQAAPSARREGGDDQRLLRHSALRVMSPITANAGQARRSPDRGGEHRRVRASPQGRVARSARPSAV